MKINIPQEFLEQEVRCDYTVTEEMKKVWAASLELLQVFSDVCEKYGIDYYCAYGNLLGAARHKGFVPWDDDVDIFVTREGYEKLCEIIKQELKPPYFWQNDHTEWGSHIAFSKLRNSNTTAILDFEKPYGYKYNQGIALDVFPLDNAPDDDGEWQKYIDTVVLLKKLTGKWSRIFEGTKLWFNRKWMYATAVLFFIPRLIVRAFKIPNIPCRLLERQLKKYRNANTAYCTMAALGKTVRYKKSCFDSVVQLPFEFFEIPAPAGYIELLDADYGDWQVFKRGAAGGCMHDGMFYDADNSYKKYI